MNTKLETLKEKRDKLAAKAKKEKEIDDVKKEIATIQKSRPKPFLTFLEKSMKALEKFADNIHKEPKKKK